MQFWIYISLLTTTIPSTCYAIIQEENVGAIDGESVELVCTSKNFTNESKWLWWRSPPHSIGTNWSPISSPQKHRFTKTYNATTSSTKLFIQDIAKNDHGQYKCTYDNDDIKAFLLKVVDDQPIQGHLKCETSFDLKSMNCCWQTGFPSNYQHFYNYRARSIKEKALSFEKISTLLDHGQCLGSLVDSRDSIETYCCAIELNSTVMWEEFYEVDVELVVQSETYTRKANFTEYPTFFVRANPPSIVSLKLQILDNKYSAKLEWKNEDVSSSYNLYDWVEYRIRYRILDGDVFGNWAMTENLHDRSYNLYNLRPNAIVEVQVATRPSRKFRGPWTSWSHSAFGNAGQIVPVYELIFRNITLLTFASDDAPLLQAEWNKYVSSHEDDFYNVIEMCECNRECTKMNISSDDETVFADLETTCVNVRGFYCNSKGCSKSTKFTNVMEDKKDQNYQFTDLALQNPRENELNVSWSFSKDMKGLHCEITIYAVSRLDEDNEAPLHDVIRNALIVTTKTVDCALQSVFISMDTMSECLKYTASVSVKKFEDHFVHEYMVGVGGWLSGSKVIPQSSTKLDHIAYIGRTNITVKLNHTDNINGSGNIDLFVAYKSKNNIRVSKAHGDFVDLRELHGATRYEIMLVTCCGSKTINSTAACVPVHDQRLFATTKIAAPSVPFNFKWNLNDGILTWDKPMILGGPLSGYSINYPSRNMTFYVMDAKFIFGKHCNVFEDDEIIVKAYNDDLQQRFYSENVTMTVPCDILVAPVHTIIIGVFFAILLVISFSSLAWCQRKKLKPAIVAYFWPTIPRPRLMVDAHELKVWNVEEGQQESLLVAETVYIAREDDGDIDDDLQQLLANPPQPEISLRRSGFQCEIPANDERKYLDTYHSSQGDSSTASSENMIPIYCVSNPSSMSSYTMPSYLMCDTSTFVPYQTDSAFYSLNQENENDCDISYSQMLCELPDDDTISLASSIMMPQIHLGEGKSFLYPRQHPKRMFTSSPYPSIASDVNISSGVPGTSRLECNFYPANSTCSYVIPQYLKQAVGASKLFQDEYFIDEYTK